MNNPCNLHNGKGDAFRHALWNGISSLLIGYDLTYSLTSAHEIGNTFIYQLQYKEKEMDLYNNNQGLSVAGFSNLFNIVQNIKDHCNLGFLRYLSNLDNNCFATYSSVLIPTNQ